MTRFLTISSIGDANLFAKNLRVARKGTAGGPSGMTAEHSRPLLDNAQDTARFWRLSEDLARAFVPEEIVNSIRLGRLTALQKPSGGVRGIVCGDIIRRIVAKTIAQQFSEVVQRATAPFQYALSTKARPECIAHALEALTDLDERATVLSINGIGAFDLISRVSMLEGLRSIEGGDSILPFVLQFYGNPSSFLWEDDEGTTHEIRQGEGGEQGDPLMPMLYALGQHPALCAIQSKFHGGEHLLAFLDDVYAVSPPKRTCDIHGFCDDDLWAHSRIQIHAGKTQIWNRAGVVPPGHDALLRAAQTVDPHAKLWCGDLDDPVSERGIKVLGTPLGHRAYVEAQLQRTADDHQQLLDRIPLIRDLQSAWLLLLFCASTRANYFLRVVHPSASES